MEAKQLGKKSKELMGEMTKSRKYDERTLKILYFFSSGICPFPGCKTRIVVPESEFDDAAVVSEIAHIHARSKGGPRFSTLMSAAERDHHSNLLALCPTHHTLADKQDSTYTANEMKIWKQIDTSRRIRQLEYDAPSVTFTELQQVAEAVVATTVPASNEITAVALNHKIEVNNLSGTSKRLINVGLVCRQEVEDCLQTLDNVIPGFQERVRSGFIEKYAELAFAGGNKDDIFQEMSAFTNRANYPATTILAVAQLSVMIYYFEKCDIFER